MNQPIFNPNEKERLTFKQSEQTSELETPAETVEEPVAPSATSVFGRKINQPIAEPETTEPDVPSEEVTEAVEEQPEVEPETTAPSSDDEILEGVIKEAAENASENEDIEHLRALQEKEFGDRGPEELIPDDAIQDESVPEGLVAAEREFALDPSGKPIFRKEGASELKASDVDIFSIDSLDQHNEESFKSNFTNISKMHNISDADATALLDLVLAYKRNPNMTGIFAKMPAGVQNQVRQICMGANIPFNKVNQVARMMLDEMVAETASDQVFVDFEKSINETMKIPSMVDIYNEHMNDTIDKKLPAMADAIQETDPEKAEKLRSLAKMYNAAASLSLAKEQYDSNSRIRKEVRRSFNDWHKYAADLNFANRNTKFRMPDATTIEPILIKRFANDPDNDLTADDVHKFITLLMMGCERMDKEDIIDAAYIYYLIKNITMLTYSDPKSTTADASSVELISNITALMYYIRAKESEFNASQPEQHDRRQKRSKRDRRK